jgi:hypothetical protein
MRVTRCFFWGLIWLFAAQHVPDKQPASLEHAHGVAGSGGSGGSVGGPLLCSAYVVSGFPSPPVRVLSVAVPPEASRWLDGDLHRRAPSFPRRFVTLRRASPFPDDVPTESSAEQQNDGRAASMWTQVLITNWVSDEGDEDDDDDDDDLEREDWPRGPWEAASDRQHGTGHASSGDTFEEERTGLDRGADGSSSSRKRRSSINRRRRMSSRKSS